MTRLNTVLFLCLCSITSFAQTPSLPSQALLEEQPSASQQNEGSSEENPPPQKSSSFDPRLPGVTMSAVIKNEFWNVLNGGLRSGTEHLLNADLTLTADLSQLAGISDAVFFIHFLGNNGESISGDVGDVQMVSNIEGYRTFKLYQCWFERSIPSADLSLLIGLFDLNAEFYVTPSSGLFLNGSHGVGIDLGQTGLNGPSIFPNTSLAFRVRYAPEGSWSFSTAVFDGRPGAADDCNSFDLTLNGQDGYFAVAETDFEQEATFKAAAGLWYYTGSFADVCAVDGLEEYVERRDNVGAYFLLDGSLYNEAENEGGLNGFLRYGVTNDHVNVIRSHFGGGLTYRGPFAERDDDLIGYAFAYAAFGNDFQKLNAFYGQLTAFFEASHELTYQGQIASWCALQYNVQYIINPSGSVDISDAVVHGVRVEISL